MTHQLVDETVVDEIANAVPSHRCTLDTLHDTQHNSLYNKTWYSRLAPILRVLLITDGTVTRTLTAFFDEDIHVSARTPQRETQAPDSPSARIETWQLSPKEPLLVRSVQLQGTLTGRIYAYAESTLRCQHLPPSALDRLKTEQIGIGELLSLSDIMTQRRIIEIGTKDHRQQSFAYRSYLIDIAGHPAIHIREHFPVIVYPHTHN